MRVELAARPARWDSAAMWAKLLDFPLVILAIALGAYYLAGGLGLMLTGLVGIICKGNPFQIPSHGPQGASSVAQTETIRKMHEQQPQRTVGAKVPYRFFIDSAICVGLIVIGYFGLDNGGLLGLSGAT